MIILVPQVEFISWNRHNATILGTQLPLCHVLTVYQFLGGHLLPKLVFSEQSLKILEPKQLGLMCVTSAEILVA